MIDVRRLRVLRELADHGTVAAAARALHLTPSAVSQQLAALSREAGVQLVEPAGRRLRLTDGGRLLLEHAHRVFAQLEQAEADLARHQAGHLGTVRIGAFATALAHLVAPAARALREQDPPVAVQAAESEERGCFAQLGEGELDVAVSVEFPGAPQRDHPRFFRQPLLTDDMDAAVPEGHPLAGAPTVSLAELADQPWVLGTRGASCHEITVVACSAAGFTPRAEHYTGDWAAAAALVAAGAAVALIPRLAQPLVPPGVRIIPLRGGSAARHVFAATRRGAESSPAIAAALSQLRRAAESVERR